MIDDKALHALVRELKTRFAEDYVAAFSSRSPARVISFYKPDARVTFHQLGRSGARGRSFTVFTGSTLGALLRRALPARLVLRLLFRQLAKRGYDHSVLSIVGVKRPESHPGPPSVEILLTFERIDRAGAIFESSAAVYRVEQHGSTWFISEGWLFDSIADAPPSLGIDRFRGVAS